MSEAKAGIDRDTVEQVANFGGENYKYGFTTEIDADKAPNGLNTDIIRFISANKEEPRWLPAWRLDAFERWNTIQEPDWPHASYRQAIAAARAAAAVALRAMLYDLHHNRESTPLPSPGRMSVRMEQTVPTAFYEAIGYRPLGNLAVRVDIIERVAAGAWEREVE